MINEAECRRKAMDSLQKDREAAIQELAQDYIHLRQRSTVFLEKMSSSLRNWLHSGKTHP